MVNITFYTDFAEVAWDSIGLLKTLPQHAALGFVIRWHFVGSYRAVICSSHMRNIGAFTVVSAGGCLRWESHSDVSNVNCAPYMLPKCESHVNPAAAY